MPQVQQDIIINLKVLSEANKLANDFKKINEANKLYQKAGVYTNKTGERFYDISTKQRVSMNELANRTMKARDALKKEDAQMKLATKNARKFKFEYLGIMFAGQRIASTMQSLIAPTAELFGIQEMFGLMMEDIMIPIMEPLSELFYELSEKIMNMSDKEKEAAGIAILSAYGFGKFFDIIGTGVLATSSFGLAWENIAGAGTIKPGIDSGDILVASSLSDKLLGTLKKLAGVGLITIGISLLLSELAGEGITWKAIAGSIATALGAKLLGVSGLASAEIGVFTLTAIILWKYVSKLAEESKAYNQLAPPGMQDIAYTVPYTSTGTRQMVSNMTTGMNPAYNPNYQVPTIIPPTATEKKKIVWWNPLTWFQEGGIVPGAFNTPVPIMAHAGERIIPANEVRNSQESIVLNVSYSINVSDKREMENLIRINNDKLVSDLRRMVET